MEKSKQTEGSMTKKMMEEYFELFNKGGVRKALSTYWAEDAIFENAVAEEYHGRENSIKFMEEVAHAGGIIKEVFTPMKIIVDGDEVAVEIVTTLVASEDLPNHYIYPYKKGETVKLRLGVFYTIREGKISRVKVYPVAVLTPTRRT